MSHLNFEHLGGRARIACILLTIGMIVDAGAFSLLVLTAMMGIDTNAAEPTDQALGFVFAMGGIGVVQIIIVITIMVFFLRWMHLAYSNLHKLQIPGLRTSPTIAMWSWFIPVLNLFRPYQVMKEIWQASDPASTADNWKTIKPPGVMGLWWGLWLLQGILGQAAFKLVLKDDSSSGAIADVLTGGSDIFSVVAALCLLKIVKIITLNQDRKFAANVESQSIPPSRN